MSSYLGSLGKHLAYPQSTFIFCDYDDFKKVVCVFTVQILPISKYVTKKTSFHEFLML